MSSTYIPVAMRREVVERSDNRCEYCQLRQEDQFFTFEIDHIIAEKHGGSTTSDNLCLACTECNAFKGSDIASVDWHSGGIVISLYHPRRDNWSDHFEIDVETGRVEPVTAKGRVTITLLRINDDERIEDRKLLIAKQRYP